MKRQVDKVGISANRVVEPVPYVKLTMVFIESALPFSALGIATAVLAFVDTSAANDARIFSSRLWTIASVSVIITPSCWNTYKDADQGLTAQVILYRVVSGVSWTSNPEHGFAPSIHFASMASQIRSAGLPEEPP
jgi:hypothetical protein